MTDVTAVLDTKHRRKIYLDTEVWSWGSGDHGQLGHADLLNRFLDFQDHFCVRSLRLLLTFMVFCQRFCIIANANFIFLRSAKYDARCRYDQFWKSEIVKCCVFGHVCFLVACQLSDGFVALFYPHCFLFVCWFRAVFFEFLVHVMCASNARDTDYCSCLSVCLSHGFTRLWCAKTAEWIEVLLQAKILGG